MDNQLKDSSMETKSQVIQTSFAATSKKYDKSQLIMMSIIIGAIMFVFGFVISHIQITGEFNFYSFLTNYRNTTSTNWTSNLFSPSDTTKYTRLNEVMQILKDGYVDKNIDEKKLINGALKGMVESLDDDPTAYFTEEETADYKKSLAGSFEGIGAELAYSEGSIYIKRLLENSPAGKSGVKIGEFIIKVDDYTLKVNDDINDVVMKIRGKGGSVVTLVLADKPNSNQTREVKITRGAIISKSMDFEDLGNNVVLIRLSRFTESSLEEFESEWDKLVTDVLKLNPKKLVLDLRGNPGGYLDGAHYIASEFLEQGKVVLHVEGRNGIEHTYTVNRAGKFKSIETVVLVNEGSASASEIFAGALQQAGRAKLIGTKTYGKGTAQSVKEPNEWNGASIHYTVQRWLLPDKRNISKTNPITPDIIVETSIEDLKKGLDPMLDKALGK